MLRIFIQNNLKINIGFNIQNTSLINLISSFILGILVALNFTNYKILFLFYIGFLGSFSTFSSFVFQLFVLLQKRKFICLFFHYIEVILLSFLCFYLGFYLMQIINYVIKISNEMYCLLLKNTCLRPHLVIVRKNWSCLRGSQYCKVCHSADSTWFREAMI